MIILIEKMGQSSPPRSIPKPPAHLKNPKKLKTYTIGHLYILNDKDVKRTWRSGVKIGDKRIFEHSFDKAKLDKEHYFCDTLEPTWRNLLGIELKPEEEDGRYSRVSGKKARKIPGHTAIPEGSYPVVISKSPRFKKWLPLVQGVPDFEGIRIHAGNYPDDTQGCILVGDRFGVDRVLDSRVAFNRLFAKMEKALASKEKITLKIVRGTI